MQIHFDPQLEMQLKAFAARNGESEDFLIVQAVKNYLEDREDAAMAKQVLAQNNPTWTQSEIERELGFDS